jgi:predicted ATPase/serine/threonine protein kinase
VNASEFQQLRDVLVTVLDLPPEEREAHLQASFSGKQELIDTARKLLKHDHGSGSLGPLGRVNGIEEAAQRSRSSRAVDDTEASDRDPDRIGEYRILRRIGAGGMGVVYLGLDPALGREVAIKVLPDSLAGGADARRRLQEEARLLARLNHANIATIHSLELDGSKTFLTMEYVSGEPLSRSSPGDELADDTVLRQAHQIACALEAAHEKGIVHRDLKPSNILVTPAGSVKILDFGLAKLAHAVSPDVFDDESFPATGDDVGSIIMGTPGYMSPEQARGEPTDQRCDVWSFGCVLYELLTGDRAFDGTPMERISATIAGDVDLEPLGENVPAPLYELLRDCLRRKVTERLPSMAEARQRLEEIQEARALEYLRERLRDDLRAAEATLPRYLTTFVGRDQDLAKLTELLQDRPFVGLTGCGGSGKTRLAVELAHRSRGHFQDGVCFVDLSPASGSESMGQRVLAALGLREQRDQSVHDTLRSALASRSVLLILDNCDSAAFASAELVAMLARSCPSVRTIATSRELLPIQGGSCAVTPLPIPGEHMSLREAAGTPALRLLCERGASVDSAFSVTDANLAVVIELCRRLDGLPLAIELAAIHLDVLTPAELLDELHQRLPSAPPDKGRPDRHRSLEAVVEWSHERLSPAERALFRRLSGFRGGWTLRAAQAVCADGDGGIVATWQILDLTRALLSKSLIIRDTALVEGSERSRFRMLETIREYAAGRLAASNEADTVRARHFSYFLEAASDSSPERRGSATWMSRMALDSENYLAALSEPYRRHVALADAATLVRKLLFYWSMAGIWQRPERCCEELIEVFERSPEAKTPPHAQVLFVAGKLASFRGDNKGASTLITDSRAIAELSNDVELVDDCDEVLTQILVDHEQGVEFADRRVHRWESIVGEDERTSSGPVDDKRRLATALFYRSHHLLPLGRCSEAESDLRRSLSIREQLGDINYATILQGALGGVRHRVGDLEGARELYTTSLERMRRSGHENINMAAALLNLGQLAMEMDDDERAETFAREARQLATRIGATSRATHALYLSGLAALRKKPQTARTRLEQCLHDARSNDLPEEEQHGLHGLMHLELREHNYDEAWRLGLDLIGRLPIRIGPMVATTLADVAWARFSLGAPHDAAMLLGAAERAIRKSDAAWPRRNVPIVASWTAAVREALGEAEFDQAWNEGCDAPLEELLERRSWNTG